MGDRGPQGPPLVVLRARSLPPGRPISLVSPHGKTAFFGDPARHAFYGLVGIWGDKELKSENLKI